MAEDTEDTWPQRFRPEHWSQWAEPTGDRGDADAIDALATLLSLRQEHQRRRQAAESRLVARAMPPSVLLVGVAGAVASGKSTIAAALAHRLRDLPHQLSATVVSTDGFLRPNAELEAEGLTLRKGFPESYDLEALRDVHRALRAGDEHLSVPVYAHELYDVAPDPIVVDRPDVLILEGVNALQGAPDGGEGPGDLADVAIYIEADEDAVIGWFTERFVALTAEARDDPDSFYRLWCDLPDGEVRQAARDVWDGINGVNLRDHIAPSRARADIEVVKAVSHAVEELRLLGG